ncbi:MAG: Ni/Fe-hydrogenase cytochrome b subunit [Syntrophomonadaceae bacterium]|nr:Ni/Fe-hydrogenase cytochrome b subunit [Syntrophomonadaceae bacterium]
MKVGTLELKFPLTPTRILLLVIFAIGSAVILYRFAVGLGPSTNLNDAWPWGWWVSFGILTGVALSGGAFVLACLVHIFNVRKFEPFLRPAILAGFLGYNTVGLTLLVELGFPYRIWHPWFYWQYHSIMFEVAWCVTLYLCVLTVEFSPVLLEKIRQHRLAHTVHRAAVPLVIAGTIISSLHQSSLGTLLLVMPTKLSPLWYTPWLPLLFYISAIFSGISFSILILYATYKAFSRQVPFQLLADLAKGLPWLMGIYLAIKLADLHARGMLPELLHANPYSLLMWAELLVGVVIPGVILSFAKLRNTLPGLFAGVWLVVIGLILNRFNASLFGFIETAFLPYFPHWMEVMMSAAIVAGVILAYIAAAENLPLLDAEHGESVHAKPLPPAHGISHGVKG